VSFVFRPFKAFVVFKNSVWRIPRLALVNPLDGIETIVLSSTIVDFFAFIDKTQENNEILEQIG